MSARSVLSVCVWPQGSSQRRRVYEPPLAVAAPVLSEPRPRYHPTRPREELRHQVGGPARRPRGQGELPGVAAHSSKKVSLRRGQARCWRRWLLKKLIKKGEESKCKAGVPSSELLNSFKPPENQLSAAHHSKVLRLCLYSTNLQNSKIDHSDQR